MIDLERARSKLHIIEQEFKQAERREEWRAKEEADVRFRVQLTRHAAIEEARRAAEVERLKRDKRLRTEIITATREAQGLQTGSLAKRQSHTAPAAGASASARTMTAVGGSRKPSTDQLRAQTAGLMNHRRSSYT